MIRSAITGPWRFAVYFLFAVGYVALGYFIPRHESLLLIGVFLFLFAGYLAIINQFTTADLIRECLILAFLFRGILLFNLPSLSDDVYRFMWDGNLVNNGINPFEHTPSELMLLHTGNNLQLPAIMPLLFEHLNSREYYSVYPPVCQAIFSITALLSFGDVYTNIILLKFIVLLFEAGTIYFLYRILQLLSIKPGRILIYALNPLIIIELCGNIHFEAGMIFFLSLSFYLLLKEKYFFSAIIFGLAVSTKLIPLVLLPLLFRYIGYKRALVYCAIAGVVTIVGFIPFLSEELILNFSTSLNLYFNEFEFNASIYYLGKLIGGWDSLEVKLFLQMALPLITLISIIGVALFYRKNDFFAACLYAIFIYFLFATTVHPWYITVLVLLATITAFRSIIYWSGLIFITYLTYRTEENIEPFILIAIIYCFVLVYFFRELRSHNKLIAETQ